MSIDEMNQKLIDLYGRDLYNNPKFRVAWSEQIEKRSGTFNEYYGDIFVRTFIGVREVKKYPHLKDCWVLEVAMPNPFDDVQGNVTYECLWAFQKSDGSSVPVNWRALQLLLYWYHNPKKRLPSDANAEEAKEIEAEIKYFEEMLKGETSDVIDSLHHKEGIVVP